MWDKLTKPQRFIKSIEIYVVVLLFGAALLITVVHPLDGDTWWHLRAGQVTFEQGKPLKIDVFSYTKYGEPWLSHEWLSELWLYLVFATGGYIGLSAWISLLGFIVAILMYRQMGGPPVFRGLLVVIAMVLLIPFYKARPQMITLVLLPLVAMILDNYRITRRKLLLWLIPLFALWANMHGGFVIGFIYFLIYFIGDCLDQFWGQHPSKCFLRAQRIQLAVVFMICLLAVMVHPLGVKVWTTVMNTLTPSAGSDLIVEWASPDFHILGQQLYLWFALVILAVLALSPRRPTWKDLLSILFFIASGFIWQRHLSFLVVFGICILSRYLWELILVLTRKFSNLSEKIKHIKNDKSAPLNRFTPRGVKMLFLVVAGILYSFIIIKSVIVNSSEQINKLENQMFPQKAVEWITYHKPEGNMMNSYNWGGYFDWYLREYPVFIDSRADLFGGEIIAQWLTVMNARDGWQSILDQWNINFIIIEPEWAIVEILPYHSWNEVYRDQRSVIFIKQGIIHSR